MPALSAHVDGLVHIPLGYWSAVLAEFSFNFGAVFSCRALVSRVSWAEQVGMVCTPMSRRVCPQ